MKRDSARERRIVTRQEYHKELLISRQVPNRHRAEPASGRVAQKRRTREDLLRAARALRERGEVPTVAQAADEAGISRATAYRYFPTQDALLAEASAGPLLDVVHEALERAKPVTDVVKRVDTVFATLAPVMLEHEAELRTLLKLSLERSLREDALGDAPLRSMSWVFMWDALLEPVRDRIAPQRYALMVRSFSTLLGIESLLVFRDTCDGDAARTVESVRYVARAMIRGFLQDLPAK